MVVGEGGRYGKKVIRHVKRVFSDDLNVADTEFLMSLCPSEAIEDWQIILKSFETEFGARTQYDGRLTTVTPANLMKWSLTSAAVFVFA